MAQEIQSRELGDCRMGKWEVEFLTRKKIEDIGGKPPHHPVHHHRHHRTSPSVWSFSISIIFYFLFCSL